METVTNQPEQETWPQIIRLSSGYTLVMFGYPVTPDTGAMKYQLLNQGGNLLLEPGGRFIIDVSWAFTTNFAPIPDGEGGAMVVFNDFRDGSLDIYGQRFDPWGNPLWGSTGLPLVVWPGTEDVTLNDVTYDTRGGFFIT